MAKINVKYLEFFKDTLDVCNDKDYFRIGRSYDNDLVLGFRPRVARHHAIIFRYSGELYIAKTSEAAVLLYEQGGQSLEVPDICQNNTIPAPHILEIIKNKYNRLDDLVKGSLRVGDKLIFKIPWDDDSIDFVLDNTDASLKIQR